MASFLQDRRFLLVLFVVWLAVMIYFFLVSVNPVSVVRFGSTCKIINQCHDIVGVDCGALSNKPYYYVNRFTGNIVAVCGGYATNLSQCPPAAWTC